MQLLHLEAWVGDGWQRVTAVIGGVWDYVVPEEGAEDNDLMIDLSRFMNDHPAEFWVETTANPHGVLFGPGVPRLFRLHPAG